MGVETVLERVASVAWMEGVFVVLVGYLDVTSECISLVCTTKKNKCLVQTLVFRSENIGGNVSTFFSLLRRRLNVGLKLRW